MTPQEINQIKTAATKMQNAAEKFQDALNQAGRFTFDKLVLLDEQVAQKKIEIAELDIQFSEKYRAAGVDLHLRLKENSKIAMEDIAEKLGYSVITRENLQELQASAIDIETKVSQVRDQVSKAIKKELETKHKIDNSETTIKLASYEALNSSLEKQIKFLEDEVANLREENRQATQRMVEIAQSRTSSDITIGK